MRVILLGRKPVACEALRYVLSSSAQVVAVVTPGRNEPDPYPERLLDLAEAFRLPVIQDEEIYACLSGTKAVPAVDLRGIDLVISILHQKRIRRPLIELPRIGCINFHPAPLPEYRGWGTYNLAILENVQRWGVAAHFMDEGFDTGPLIKVLYFDVDASKETALSLMLKTQPFLFQLFKEVFKRVLQDGTVPSSPQGEGRSISKKEILSRRFVLPEDPPEVVDRKIRAFWYPPNPSAAIKVGSQYYPLINDTIQNRLAPLVLAEAWRNLCEHLSTANSCAAD